jgi:hypothetical protein
MIDAKECKLCIKKDVKHSEDSQEETQNKIKLYVDLHFSVIFQIFTKWKFFIYSTYPTKTHTNTVRAKRRAFES